MKVADLQQHLMHVRQLLEAAGAGSKITSDIISIGQGLQPFREFGLKEFADFLIRAEAYSRGEVPIAPSKKGKGTPKTTTQAATKPDVAALAAEAKQLYEQASASSTTLEMIEHLASRISGLDKKGLTEVAMAIDLKIASSTTKPAILQAIRNRIIDRKGSFQRAGLLDRPTETNQTVPSR